MRWNLVLVRENRGCSYRICVFIFCEIQIPTNISPRGNANDGFGVLSNILLSSKSNCPCCEQVFSHCGCMIYFAASPGLGNSGGQKPLIYLKGEDFRMECAWRVSSCGGWRLQIGITGGDPLCPCERNRKQQLFVSTDAAFNGQPPYSAPLWWSEIKPLRIDYFRPLIFLSSSCQTFLSAFSGAKLRSPLSGHNVRLNLDTISVHLHFKSRLGHNPEIKWYILLVASVWYVLSSYIYIY